MSRISSTPSRTERPARQRPVFQLIRRAAQSSGVEGNERLTAMTGAVLLILLLVECYTVLRIGHLLTLHVFLGMLLLGPVALKAASVLYRFTSYYTGSAPYRRKGPPAPLLRVIGPIIMLLTACVLGSGVMLAVVGPFQRGTLADDPPALVHRLGVLHHHSRAGVRVAAAEVARR